MEGPTSDQGVYTFVARMLLVFFLLDAAGLMLYIWIVVGVVIATGLSVILIGAVIIITLRKKVRF